MLQLTQLHNQFDQLQKTYGAPNLQSIYGAGCINNPQIAFVFMNPTGKNVSSNPIWAGIRAPWLGTKPIWQLFSQLNIIDQDLSRQIQNMKLDQWTPNFSAQLYEHIAGNSAYITNLAKCTQIDARPLSNSVFKMYLDLMNQEINIIKPQAIITFGNQVSSILLERNVSVSNYTNGDREEKVIGDSRFSIYPTYYPVGQGRRNMPLAVQRVKEIVNSLH